MKKQEIYHLTFGEKRTTITVDRILSELMAYKLKQIPGTTEAHSSLRQWIQSHLSDTLRIKKLMRGEKLSQFVRQVLILEVADKRLVRKRRAARLASL